MRAQRFHTGMFFMLPVIIFLLVGMTSCSDDNPTQPDTTAPTAVADLATGVITSTSVVLNWTASGDDGATGTAHEYDIRYSTSAISGGNFASATRVTGAPLPGTSGSDQTMTVSGLAPDTPYFFAIKPADEVPNWSGISNVVQASTSDPTAVSTPTFSPLPGSYTSTQSVTIATVTSGATIRYTTDGSTPTESSPTYTAPVSISATTTLKARSWKSGLTMSAVASGYYEIGNMVSTPAFDPLPGSYTTTQSVTITTITSGATIRYTTDGSTPTESSPTYTAPVSIAATTTLKARSWKSGLTMSAVASGYYEIGNIVTTPSFSPPPGTYSSTQSVTITTVTSGATIRYTTDGSTPTESSPTYTAPVSISATTTLQARSWKVGFTMSSMASGYFEIGNVVSMPSFSPLPGTYSSTQLVTMSNFTLGATIYYTTDGSTPTISSPTYTTPVSISSTTTLKARSWKSGLTMSAVASGYYEIGNMVSMPTFSPLPGTYAVTQSVTISNVTSGATTHYTTDGSTPTESSPTYTAPVSISATTTLKARSWKSGSTSSAVTSGEYEIHSGVSTRMAATLREPIR